ncbi:MAG: cytochrome c [gamma proteobacterium endosymbiont of Lamellibrachia anaximandri]|nr:cytochrome c [gamma proteobacterium endosymbiont of Lamellibrachia anaximandri]MBL3535118.1 cytochrome c [gamma proteobacterium endosymbiont of Lamellibrachia anaximandri]MBL3591223.1 cytochrome c [gamma proteobacterium endosymbiont of Lamellibrachia anaximandri]MBL3618344.1 cytochrome c [gamma proteobacterium endosymbiont of Lamellibrachia anaximandri]
MKNIQSFIFTLSTVCSLVALSPSVMADAAAGRAVYDGSGACGACHGALGKGDGPAAAALDPKPRSFSDGVFKYDTDGDGSAGTDTDLFNIIKYGSAAYGGAATMPGRADIPDSDLQSIVAYIRTLKN